MPNKFSKKSDGGKKPKKPPRRTSSVLDFFARKPKKSDGGGKKNTPNKSESSNPKTPEKPTESSKPFQGNSFLKNEMGMTQTQSHASPRGTPQQVKTSPEKMTPKQTKSPSKKRKPHPSFGSQAKKKSKKQKTAKKSPTPKKKSTPVFGNKAKTSPPKNSPPKQKRQPARRSKNVKSMKEDSDSESEPIVPRKRKRKVVQESDGEDYNPFKDETGATFEQEEQDDEQEDEPFEMPTPQKESVAPPKKKKRKMNSPPRPVTFTKKVALPGNADEVRQKHGYQEMELDTSSIDNLTADQPQIGSSDFEKPTDVDPNRIPKGLHNKDVLKKQSKKEKEKKLKKDPRGENWYEIPRDHDDVPHTHPDAKRWQISIPPKRMQEFTPGMRSYWDAKRNHFDGILLYKCGKFYEIYFKDADICTEVLHLSYMNDDIPHVGFPEISVDKYVNTLVFAGYKVYRVEEMESVEETQKRTGKSSAPKLRAVCASYSPGTHVGLSLQEKYTFSMYEVPGSTELEGSRFYIIWLAASTADFFIDEFQDDRHRSALRGVIAQYMPTELIYEKGCITEKTLEMIRRDNPDVHVHDMAPIDFWSQAKVESVIQSERYFGDEEWPAALTAIRNNEKMMNTFGGLLSYLTRHMLDREFMLQKRFTIYDRTVGDGQKFLVLDRSSMDNLHIFRNDLGGTRGTLFRLINHCTTGFGSKLLRNWLRRPLITVNDIQLRQDAVTNLLRSENMMDDMRSYLVSLPDLMRLKTRICRLSTGRKIDTAFFHGGEFNKGKVTDVIKFLGGFRTLMEMYEELHTRYSDIISTSPRLQAITTPGQVLWNFRDPIEEIISMFDYKHAAEQYVIQPSPGSEASARFKLLTKEVAEMRKKAKVHMQKIKAYFKPRAPKKKFTVFKSQTAKIRAFSVNLTAKLVNEHGLPDGWFRENGFVTNKQLKVLGAEAWDRKVELANIEQNYATEVFRSIHSNAEGIDSVVDCVAELDCLLSLARCSSDGWCAPKIVDADEPILDVKQSIHPCCNVQDSMSASTSFIPNDIQCGGPGKKFVVVTGPNMGGKSTILRQVCVLQILAQLGCYIPATSATLSPVDRIFTRIGANDNILAGQSTFMVELEETSTIMKNATKRSLVILDELGRGTSTYDGAAIAFSVAEHVTQNIGCRTMFSTHYHRITQELGTLPDTDFYHLAFRVDDKLQKVVFLYKFVHGLCNSSHGINCARLANIPAALVDASASFAESFKEMQKTTKLDEVFDRFLDVLDGDDVQNIFEKLAELAF